MQGSPTQGFYPQSPQAWLQSSVAQMGHIPGYELHTRPQEWQALPFLHRTGQIATKLLRTKAYIFKLKFNPPPSTHALVQSELSDDVLAILKSDLFNIPYYFPESRLHPTIQLLVENLSLRQLHVGKWPANEHQLIQWVDSLNAAIRAFRHDGQHPLRKRAVKDFERTAKQPLRRIISGINQCYSRHPDAWSAMMDLNFFSKSGLPGCQDKRLFSLGTELINDVKRLAPRNALLGVALKLMYLGQGNYCYKLLLTFDAACMHDEMLIPTIADFWRTDITGRQGTGGNVLVFKNHAATGLMPVTGHLQQIERYLALLYSNDALIHLGLPSFDFSL